MNYPIDIRRCSDGQERSLVMEFEDWGMAHYMFADDGNYGCDCNRQLFWLRCSIIYWVMNPYCWCLLACILFRLTA